ncbi:TonB-dependent siderophore receptor [Aestuariibacter sp. A3R04]|uniref:TonB-dependent receptor plug domain-containing protein n=1 Tax=Aestuariibacter sp. A3R04 TaxID=2841571 RepID=UPI001C0951BB|nr:TonB-dependent receptor [Aestuariibacter sp. A3R04]MBU3020349.1 TonB-dependent receptor [Aestuariibacter sp. A3R04]
MKTTFIRSACAVAIASQLMPTSGFAETTGDAVKSVESIIVTGTRQSNRTAFDSMAPIDLISGDTLNDTMSEDLLDSMAQLVPSFNVKRLPMADGQVFVRPASLRGLSSDHTLVLINGKRLHRSALLGSNGAQSADLATIPSYAIKRIEVLRDGASAQYGSDAIAGVINIILDDREGYKAFTQFSQYYEGDGTAYRAGAQAGWHLDNRGYLTLSAEYYDADRTARSRQRPDAIAYQDAHPEITLRNPVQDWGQPERQAVRFAFNSQYDISDTSAIYFYGTYNDGEGLSDFNWRNPESGVFNQSTAYPDFDLLAIYPAGFSPQFGQEDTDYSLYAGVKGGIGDISWDLSASAGGNEIDYFLSNTINASLGSTSPTAFYAGSLSQDETTINADGVYVLSSNVTSGDINIAFGAEYREETYKVSTGDEASYTVGPAASEGLPSGSNGFFGFSPAQAGEFDQDSYAIYLDIESELTDALTLGIAGRYEDFSVFGSSTNGKISARYAVTENIALRSTYSTGFRAPTPGQLFSERVSQGLDTNTLEVFTRGRYSPEGPIAEIINQRADANISSLTPEQSDNVSVGVTYQGEKGLTASLDFYRVEIEDRFGTSSTYSLTADERNALINLGVTGAESITSVNFYQNDFDTKTTGLDAVVSQRWQVSSGEVSLVAAYNYNKTEVLSGNVAQNETQRTLFEDRLPKHTANVSATYHSGDWSYLARVRYYGKWTDSSGNSDGDIYQDFGAEAFVDVGVNYQFSEMVKVSANIENLFDSYPDEATFQANRGLIYSRNAPYDTDGGSYSLRLDVAF